MQESISFPGGIVMSYSTGDFPVMADGRTVGRVNIIQNGQLLVFDCTCNYRSHDVVRLAAVCSGKYVPLGITMPYDDRPDSNADAAARTGNLHLRKSFTKNALIAIGYHDPVSFHLIRPGAVYTETEESSSESAIEETSFRNAASSAPEKEPEVVLPTDEAETIVYNDFPDPIDYAYDFEPEPYANIVYSEPAEQAHEPGPVSDALVVVPSALSSWTKIPNPGILFDDHSIQETCEGLSNALIMEQDEYVLLAVPVLATEPFPMMPVFCFGRSGDIDDQEYIIFKIKNRNLTL